MCNPHFGIIIISTIIYNIYTHIDAANIEPGGATSELNYDISDIVKFHLH